MTKTKLDRAALNKCTKAQLIAIIEVFVANEQKPQVAALRKRVAELEAAYGQRCLHVSPQCGRDRVTKLERGSLNDVFGLPNPFAGFDE